MFKTPKTSLNPDKLITAVQKYPALYDPKNEDYTNPGLKTTLWKIVARECHAKNEVLAYKRWRSLRDYYCKLRKLKYGKRKRGMWMYRLKLDFLKNIVDSNYKETTDMAEEQKPLTTFSNEEDEESLMEDMQGEECNDVDVNSCEYNGVVDLQAKDSFNDPASIKRLINAVKNYRILYDTNHPEYSLVPKKNMTWERVAEECKFPDATVCRTKWKNVRDYYKKLMKTQGSCKIKWCYTKDMKFMDPIFNKLVQKKDQDNSSTDSDEPLTSYSNRHFEKQLKSVETTNKMIMDYLQKKVKETGKNTKHDSLSVFFKSMEDLVRKFSIARQLEAKCKISALIFGIEAAEMKEQSGIHNNNTVPMNTGALGPSSNVFINNSNNCNVPYQNSNMYPPCPPQPHLTSQQFTQQFVTLSNQPMHFHPRMSNFNKNK